MNLQDSEFEKKSGFAMFFFTRIKVFWTYFYHLFFNYCSLFWNSFEQRLIIIILLLLRLPLIIIIIITIIVITRKTPGALTPPLFSPLVSSTTGTSTLLSSISTQLPPRNLLRRLHHQTQPRVCPLIGERVHTCVLGLVAQLIERR